MTTDKYKKIVEKILIDNLIPAISAERIAGEIECALWSEDFIGGVVSKSQLLEIMVWLYVNDNAYESITAWRSAFIKFLSGEADVWPEHNMEGWR